MREKMKIMMMMMMMISMISMISMVMIVIMIKYDVDDDDNFRMREEFYPYQILFSCVIVSFNLQSSSSSLSCRRHVGSWKI